MGKVGSKRHNLVKRRYFPPLPQVAARHHAVVVLSAVVCAVGLAASAPYLVEYGLHSTAWRTREGSLKLVIAGMILHCTSRDSDEIRLEETGAACSAVHSNRRKQEAGSLAGDSDVLGEKLDRGNGVRRERQEGKEERGLSTGYGKELTMPEKESANERSMAIDEEGLIRSMGSFLADERPEVIGVD